MTNSAEHLRAEHAVGFFFLKVILPFVILMVMWPIYRYIIGLDHAFGKAFAHGDLLIFAALLLMEVAQESKETNALLADDAMPRLSHAVVGYLAITVSFLLIFILGVIKYDVVSREGADDVRRFVAYSCLSCSVAICAVFLSGWSVYRTWNVCTTRLLVQHGAEGVRP